MVVAYLRVSTGRQTLTNQRHEIARFDGSRNMVVDCWVTEVVSGRKKRYDRKLGETVKRLRAGDTLIVTELSRLSRTLTDIMVIVGNCSRKECTCIVPKIVILLMIPLTARCCVLRSDWWPRSSETLYPLAPKRLWRHDVSRASYSGEGREAIPSSNA